MIRLLLFALLFAMPAAADNVFMDNTTSESNMCVIGITGQTTSNPAAVARATYSPITYTCSPGTYLPADGIECVACPGGKYCEGGQYTYNETTPQGITGDITAGYYSSGGASTATGSTCLSGYSCGNCASAGNNGLGANGRYLYSNAGASSCSECPAETGELASRVSSYYGWWPNDVHNTIGGCGAFFTDADDDATFSTICWYSVADGGYGGPNSYCQTYAPSACIAGYGSIIEDYVNWADSSIHGNGVDFAKGSVCGPCAAGTYSAAGDTTCTACPANYTSSAGAAACSPMSYNINYVLNGGNALPSGYTQLEYLEATGGQYIDTGITFNNNIGVKTKFNKRYYNGDDDQVVIGVTSAGSQNNRDVFLINPARGFYLTFAEWYADAWVEDTVYSVDYEVSVNYMNDRKRYLNGTGVLDIATTAVDNPNTMYLFAGHLVSSQIPYWYFGGRIYYTQITNGTSFVRNFIPVRRNSDNVLGMYDTVTGTFFTNSGTGTFTAGPDTTTTPTSTYTYDTGATIDFVPTRSHSSFVGWCTDAGLTNCAAIQTISTTATGDKTFYAKYLCDTGYSTNVSNTACDANTITIDWSGYGAGNNQTQSTQCTYGGSITTPIEAPTRRGHVFVGWTFDLGN